jgi:TolA-binding protein
MMVRSSDANEDPTLDAFADTIRNGAGERSASDLEQGLSSLSARLATGTSRRRRWIRPSFILIAGSACLLLGLTFAAHTWKQGRVMSTQPSYRIEGGSVLEGGYLRESGHEGMALYFNEGSNLSLTPGTRGRLRAIDKTGARVAIEKGTASFHVVPGSDRRWLVEVGPFLVTVKGTIFTVSWDPSSERFELMLRHGRVVVSGPTSGGDIILRAGQRLVVSLARAETVITEEKIGPDVLEHNAAPAAGTALPSTTRPSTEKERVAGPRGATPATSPATSSEGDRHWTDALESGHWDRILDEVERTGVAKSLNRASSADLFALANAARYRRRLDLARTVLLAVRRRFPNSPRALDALFLLGRVEESRGHGAARAIGWYDEYLTRAPAGPYAAEALGRKMTVTSESEGPAAARPIADEYLRRFPKGSYVGSARALLRVP